MMENPTTRAYTKGLQIAQQVQQGEEALGLGDVFAGAADSAARMIGVLNVLFNGNENGYRRQGVDVEAEAGIIGSHPQSKGPGLVFQTPGTGSTASKSGQVRGPRISGGPIDIPAFFHAGRQYDDYKPWDSTAGYAHPDLQMNVPVQAGMSYLLIAYSEVLLYAATTATKLSMRITIGSGTTETDPTWDSSGGAYSRRHYIQSGVQAWQTLSAFHARYVTVDNPTPNDAGEPVLVQSILYREGTAGNNRLGNGYTVVLKLPV